MQILQSNYTLHPENYRKITPKTLKLIADIGLLISGILELAPEFPGKEWLVFAGIAFKLITKFVSEQVPV